MPSDLILQISRKVGVNNNIYSFLISWHMYQRDACIITGWNLILFFYFHTFFWKYESRKNNVWNSRVYGGLIVKPQTSDIRMAYDWHKGGIRVRIYEWHVSDMKVPVSLVTRVSSVMSLICTRISSACHSYMVLP